MFVLSVQCAAVLIGLITGLVRPSVRVSVPNKKSLDKKPELA